MPDEAFGRLEEPEWLVEGRKRGPTLIGTASKNSEDSFIVIYDSAKEAP